MTEKNAVPLVVDLDGTLIYSDLLIESFLGLIKKNPLYLIMVVVWLFRGKAVLKREIAKRVDIDFAVMPYNQEVIDFVKQAKSEGRSVLLATASDEKYGLAINQYLGLFDEVLATNLSRNLSGDNKRIELVERYGERGFDYVGNAKPDIKVWRSASQAIVVSYDDALIAEAKKAAMDTLTIRQPKPALKTYLKAMRIHQWLKNVLILVPLVTAHVFFEFETILLGLLAFVAFGFCASSVYLLNDLLDLEDDRHHGTKCKRPFASGSLPILHGALLTPTLLLLSFLLALLLPGKFYMVLCVYYVLTTAYSFYLKKQVVLDVIMLAVLYTIRIIAGAAAINVMPSFWLLAFSMFIFLSLAIVKRCTELRGLIAANKSSARGRGYGVEDMELLYSLGTASGYISVLVLALYVNSDKVSQLYTTPEAIWLLCPIMLYWVSRVWVLAHRGEMNDDPIVFALTDNTSRITAILMGLVVLFAI